MRNVREAILIVEIGKHVGHRELKGVGTEALACSRGDGPFLVWSPFSTIENDVPIHEIVIEPMEVIGQANHHVATQPGRIIGGRPMEEGILIVLAEPLPQPVKTGPSSGLGADRDGPHFREVEGEEPALGSVDALLYLHGGILQEHLRVRGDISPFGNGLKPKIEHADTVHKGFDVALTPLDVAQFTERQQRGRV